MLSCCAGPPTRGNLGRQGVATMLKTLLATAVLAIALAAGPAGQADCRGCCSRHGGVVCENGVTKCRDGTPLSAKCAAKGCNKCPKGGGKKK